MYIPQKHGVPLAERPLAHTVDAPIGAGSSDRFWDDPSIKLAVDLTWKEENDLPKNSAAIASRTRSRPNWIESC
jgi:hypothetical protein